MALKIKKKLNFANNVDQDEAPPRLDLRCLICSFFLFFFISTVWYSLDETLLGPCLGNRKPNLGLSA